VVIFEAGSTAIYRTGTGFSASGRAYGNLDFDGTSSSWSTSTTGTSTLTISGDLNIGSGVTWNTGGFSGDISVDGNTTISGTWTKGAGDGDQGTHIFRGSFTINSGGQYSLATTGPTQNDIYFENDLINNGTFTTPSNRNIFFNSEGGQSISGSSVSVFNNGFSASTPTLTIASGVNVQVAAGKTATAEGNLTVDGTLSGAGSFVSNSAGITITNGGEISVATAQLNGGESPKYLTGSGTWSGCNLTIGAACSLELSASQTFSSCSITNHGSIEVQSYAFRMIGGTFTNAADGYVHGYYDSFETEGAVTITQDGTFEETLVVKNGSTATAHGVFSEPIIVQSGGTLAVPAGVTLVAEDNVEVSGSVAGGDANSTFRLTGRGEGSYSLVLNDAHISIAKVVLDDGNTREIQGSASFGGTTVLKLDATSGLELTADLTITGGTIQIIDGSIDVFSCTLTLNGVSLNISSSGQVVDNEGGGDVVTEANTTIDQGGVFSLPLEVNSGTATIQGVFDDIQIDNPGSVTLSGATTINGTLNALGGNLTTGVHMVTLGSVGTIAETSPYSVVGKLTTTRQCSTGVNQTFGGMGVEINAAGAWPGTTTVTRVTGAAPTFPPGIPVKRYFDITPATNTGLNATFVYRYFDNELNGNTESGIQLYNSTDAGSTWSAKGGALNTTDNTLTLAGVDGFSWWIAGGTGNPAPTLTSVAPSTVELGSTATLTLTGTGFAGGLSTPSLDPDFSVNSFTVLSPTEIRMNITVSLAASVGARSVTVTNAPPGGGSVTLTGAFSLVFPPPSLSNIAPTSASRGQTLNVVLNGRGYYSEATSVDFGSNVTVNSLSVNNTSQMTANVTVGAEAATGPRGVSVSNGAPGGGSTTLNNAFTIGNPAPTLASASPATGVRGETVNVILTGTNFIAGVSTVSFGSGITVDSSTVNSATQMTVHITISLDAALGARDVSVVNPAPSGGTTVLSGGFTVSNPAPTLASITPTSGSRGQTLNVTVTGTNFIPGVTTPAYGSGITVNSVSSFTSTQVTASVTIDIGATAGPRDITVTNAAPGGGTATLSGAFMVNNPSPTLSSVSPSQAGRGSSINVVMTGTNFLEGVSSVSFGPDVTVNSTTINSATQITVNISIALSAATGARNVSVTNATPGGGTATLTGGFTVDTSPATSVENTLSAIPDEYVLQEAYPNPFNPSTRIRYGLPEQSRVKLEVYNMLGNVVAELVSGERSKGLYEVEWRAENLPSGVYLVRVFSESVETSKRFIASRKVVLVK
jgi:hypothetical protein